MLSFTASVALPGQQRVISFTGATRSRALCPLPAVRKARTQTRRFEAASAKLRTIESNEDWNEALEASKGGLVVAMFSAKTCGPCIMIQPKIVEFAEKFNDVVFVQIKGDTNEDTKSICKEQKIKMVPTFRFMFNGEKIDHYSGAKADEILEHIERNKAKAEELAAM
eukprot:tig00021123_g18520.t1